MALPWARLALLALAGAIAGTSLALLDLRATDATNGGLIHTGPDGPAARLLAHDFPDEPQSPNGEHDGPMFYAIARDPLDLSRAAESLDRPRYRLQHPLFSWVARALHPVGAGDGLLITMFGVGVGALFLGGVALGALSCILRGPPALAAVFGVLPGAVMSLRITTADALAVALVLAAVALSLRGRAGLAGLVAVAAVLTKEPVVLTLVGVALWRRDREGLALVVPPALIAAAWWLWLHLMVADRGVPVMEFGVPLVGLASSMRLWVTGIDVYAMVSVVLALGTAVAALGLRRFAHPLALALALQTAFLLLLTRDVIGLTRNGTRMSLPVLCLAVLMLATPEGGPVGRALVQRPARRSTTGAMASTASTPMPMPLMP